MNSEEYLKEAFGRADELINKFLSGAIEIPDELKPLLERALLSQNKRLPTDQELEALANWIVGTEEK